MATVPVPPVSSDPAGLGRKGRSIDINNPYFAAAYQEKLIEKRRLDHVVNSSLTSILSCRLREGYTVNTVHHSEGEIRVRLTLPWKHQTFLHYTVLSAWPAPPTGKCKVEVSIEGPYEILFDIICQKDKQFASHFRTAVIKKFYSTLSALQQTDILLAHLHSFSTNPAHFTVPDPVRSGLPLFELNPGHTAPQLYSSDCSLPQFTQFWRPVCSLDIAVWHRWLHTHRLGLLLQHDHPLPKHLLATTSAGRYHAVQCRKAAGKLYEVIKSWADFCLLENHSYVRFIRTEDESGTSQPTSFYVIRVTSKPPCVVVWLAFLGGIPGSIRNQIFHELRQKVESLTITQRVCWRDLPPHRIKPVQWKEEESEGEDRQVPASPFSEVFACVPMSKPVEKILIRYERMPEDFCSVLGFFPGRPESPGVVGRGMGQEAGRSASRNASAAFLTLSRYLRHQRWIWSVQSSPSQAVTSQAVARILNTLCKIRLHEGFTFAHSSNGIQNLVLELDMQQEDSGAGEQLQEEDGAGAGQSCALQYIIFPPHTTHSGPGTEDSVSEVEGGDTDSAAGEAGAEQTGEVQIITELWVEPQAGRVRGGRAGLAGLQHQDIAARLFPRDLQAVSTLLTFEHLCLMCSNPCVSSPSGGLSLSCPGPCQPQPGPDPGPHLPSLTTNTAIQHIPFAFSLSSLLPASHQTELLFSLLIQVHTFLYFGLCLHYYTPRTWRQVCWPPVTTGTPKRSPPARTTGQTRCCSNSCWLSWTRSTTGKLSCPAGTRER